MKFDLLASISHSNQALFMEWKNSSFRFFFPDFLKNSRICMNPVVVIAEIQGCPLKIYIPRLMYIMHVLAFRLVPSLPETSVKNRGMLSSCQGNELNQTL